MDRYVFTFTGRYDGSSLLARGNQWKFFPSAAFAWRVNEEGFLKDVDMLSNLKLRASLGVTGNQNIGYAAPYAIINSARVPVGGAAFTGMRPSSLANPDLGWENTVSTNIGVDIGFFDNRFRLSGDIYKRVTKDLLLNFTLPASSGYNNIPMNLGQISNEGIELEASADILTKTAVKWSVSANWYLNRNMVDDIGGNSIQGQNYLSGGGTFNQSLHRTLKGHPIGSFYGYVVDGIYQNATEAALAPIDSPQATPGSLRFLDIGGPDGVPDGRITADDMTILGTSQPDFNYGFSSDVSWKGLKLSLMFTGSVGAKVANMNRYILDGFTNTNSNISRAAWEGRWTGEGTSNFYPKVDGSNASVFFYQRFSNMFLEDATYFRLKNLTVNYTFSFKKSTSIKNLGVFFTATNLFTITDYTGYDPEVSISNGALSPNVDFAAYPSCRTYSFGVNFGF
jgi:TonB-linked SusC/RagA family outer membrane protein